MSNGPTDKQSHLAAARRGLELAREGLQQFSEHLSELSAALPLHARTRLAFSAENIERGRPAFGEIVTKANRFLAPSEKQFEADLSPRQFAEVVFQLLAPAAGDEGQKSVSIKEVREKLARPFEPGSSGEYSLRRRVTGLFQTFCDKQLLERDERATEKANSSGKGPRVTYYRLARPILIAIENGLDTLPEGALRDLLIDRVPKSPSGS